VACRLIVDNAGAGNLDLANPAIPFYEIACFRIDGETGIEIRDTLHRLTERRSANGV
jgi:hypothetical protein